VGVVVAGRIIPFLLDLFRDLMAVS
jgi:hypothetical protein